MTKKPTSLGARNETGGSADWWFIYKISAESRSSNNQSATGNEYLYYDDTDAKEKRNLTLSTNHINENKGALFETLNQIMNTKSNHHLGWFFYNDENPDQPKKYKNPNTKTIFKPGYLAGNRGHTKGVLAFDFSSNSGFWLIHSTPKFPQPGKFVFLNTAFKMAQTFLCISLKDATTAMKIAQQMFVVQQPNIYAASTIPTELKGAHNDDRVLLMQNKISSTKTSFTSKIPFLSKKGQSFQAIAKNKWWKQDFYNDLVGPALHVNLEVETWEHGKTPLPADSDKIHKVTAMKSVNLNPLNIPFSWSEELDHAKLAISDSSEKIHWVCVGDINFTISQEKRGGGTVAFQCEPLWKALNKILETKDVQKKKKNKLNKKIIHIK